MNHQALDLLEQRAIATHSDALIVCAGGQTLRSWYSPLPHQPIHIMSCTKSVVGLAFGHLLDHGSLSSLDLPVATFYPEWRQGQKHSITIRMLLNHTSGLQNIPNAGVEIEPTPDVIQLALAAELTTAPGKCSTYNNKAVNLLAGIIERVSGQRLDQFVEQVLFAPLGIDDYHWLTDRVGTPYVMAGLFLHPVDLARVGQVVAQRGIWQGQSIVSDTWLDELLKQSQPYRPAHGLLWWRLLDAKKQDVVGYYSEGWLGQYLVILPQEQIVVVRLKRRVDDENQEKDAFPDCIERVRALLSEDAEEKE